MQYHCLERDICFPFYKITSVKLISFTNEVVKLWMRDFMEEFSVNYYSLQHWESRSLERINVHFHRIGRLCLLLIPYA